MIIHDFVSNMFIRIRPFKSFMTNNFTTPSIVAFLLVMSFVSLPANVHAQQSEEFLSYSSAEYGITIDYPSSWYTEEYPDSLFVIFYPPYAGGNDDFPESVGIFTEGVKKGTTLDQYASSYMDKLEAEFPDSLLVESKKVTIDNNPAKRMAITVDLDEDRRPDLKLMRVFVFEGGRAYVMFYDADLDSYNSYLSNVDDMVDSIKIDNSQLPPAPTGETLLDYEDPVFSIEYPDNWIVSSEPDQNGLSATYFTSMLEHDLDPYYESVAVFHGDAGVGTSLDDFTNNFIVVITGMVPNFKVVESKPSTLAALPANKIAFTSSIEDVGELKGFLILTIYRNEGFAVGFISQPTAYDRFLTTVNKMVDSFEISIAGVSGQPRQSLETKEYLTYENADHAMTIQYPDNWAKDEFSAGSGIYQSAQAIFSSPANDAAVLVNVDNMYLEQKTLDELTASVAKDLEKSVSLLKIEESSTGQLDGHPAGIVVYSGLLDVFGSLVSMKAMQMWTIVENKEYVITFAALPEKYESYLPVAQKMIDSFEIDETKLPKVISGSYENSDLALKIDLPKGWSGVEGSESLFDTDQTMKFAAIAFPKLGSITSLEDIENISALGIAYADLEDLLSGDYSPSEECVTSPNLSIVAINAGLKAAEFEVECESIDSMMKGKAYFFATEENNAVYVVYMAFSEAAYNDHLSEFEESVKTLQIENTLNLSDMSSYSATSDYKVLSEQVTVNENPYEIEIVTNSEISDFSLDREANRMTFVVDGQSGTAGSVLIKLGHVLEGPYTVTIDGDVADRVIIIDDKTMNQKIVEISYLHSVHEIAITGTQVIPEFPAFAVGILLASVAAVVVLSRKFSLFASRL